MKRLLLLFLILSFIPAAFAQTRPSWTQIKNKPLPSLLEFGASTSGSAADNGIIHKFETAAPVAGSFVRGSIVWNTVPSAGGTAGWICVAAGTPGTWKTFGAITP